MYFIIRPKGSEDAQLCYCRRQGGLTVVLNQVLFRLSHLHAELCLGYNSTGEEMVTIAQLAEHLVVAQKAAGSSPAGHPYVVLPT